jgi:hypothetical protein
MGLPPEMADLSAAKGFVCAVGIAIPDGPCPDHRLSHERAPAFLPAKGKDHRFLARAAVFGF